MAGGLGRQVGDRLGPLRGLLRDSQRQLLSNAQLHVRALARRVRGRLPARLGHHRRRVADQVGPGEVQRARCVRRHCGAFPGQRLGVAGSGLGRLGPRLVRLVLGRRLGRRRRDELARKLDALALRGQGGLLGRGLGFGDLGVQSRQPLRFFIGRHPRLERVGLGVDSGLRALPAFGAKPIASGGGAGLELIELFLELLPPIKAKQLVRDLAGIC